MSDLILDRVLALNVDQLARVLSRRGALSAPWPTDLGDLAAFLREPELIADAFLRQSTPHTVVISAVVLNKRLGRPSSIASVAAWLGTDTVAVQTLVDELAEWMLLWEDTHGRIVLPATYPMSPDLGESVRVMVGRESLAQLRTVATKLAIRGDGTREDVVDRLLAFYDDGAAVRELISTATTAEQQLLEQCTRSGAVIEYHGYSSNPPGRWSVDRGVLWWVGENRAWMPLEVTLALLGEKFTLPFEPEPPPLDTRPIPTDQIEAESATTLLRFVECIAHVVDSVRTTPVTLLKSGEIGVRTVRQLSKDLGFGTDEVTFALHLAEALDLLIVVQPPPPTGRRKKVQEPATLEAGDASSMWVAADAAVRGSSALAAWWTSPHMALGGRDVHDIVDYGTPQRLRYALLSTYCGVPTGSGAVDNGQVDEAVGWYAPFVDRGDIDLLAPLVRREAELIGALALGAVGSVGRTLLNGDDLAPVVAHLMSSAHTRAVIGADLTAVVFGPPEPGLSQFLDNVAERESTGSATTWRFGKSSVRGAFDRGADVDELIADLERYSESGVPQALEYLVRDVARTHGGLAAIAVGSVLVSDNEALLREVAANRRLATLELVVLAPTVVGSACPPARTLEALREAGYAPVERDGTGQIKLERGARTAGLIDEDGELDLHFDDASYLADPVVLAAHLVETGALPVASVHDEAQLLTGFDVMRERYEFLAGATTPVVYDGDVHVVHSARIRGSAVEMWNVDEDRYDLVDAGAITPFR